MKNRRLGILASVVAVVALIVSPMLPRSADIRAALLPTDENATGDAEVDVADAPGTADAFAPLAFDCTTVSEIPQAECQALVAFYNSTNGPGWTNNSNWLVTNTPCSWDGVSCSGGHVSYLRLSQNQLSGPIPPHLGNLANLRELWLGVNQLSGSIPPELGNLGNLTYLDVCNNQLSGSVPPELGNLTSLGVLALCDNQLSGGIPPELGNLTSLGLLALFANQLSGSIPPELGHLTRLSHLGLDDNQLSGGIPPQLGNLTDLRELDVSDNRLSGSIPWQLAALINLLFLRINDNPLSGPLPQSLTALRLVSFDFQNTELCEPRDAAFQAWLAGIGSLRRTGVLCARPTATPTCAVPELPSPYSLRVNTGGSAYTDGDGLFWQADRDDAYCTSPYWGATGGQVYTTTQAIDATADDALYQSQRYFAGQAGYRFAVPNGQYDVRLRFAEIYPYSSLGGRIFDVRAEGQTIVSDLDVFARSGGLDRSYDITATVTVADGYLNLDFVPHPGSDAAIVNAIAVTQLMSATPTATPTSAPTETVTATPTATPTASLALPDLTVSSVKINMRGFTWGCVTRYDTLVLQACVTNAGIGNAGPFTLQAGGSCLTSPQEWRVDGLPAGETACLESAGTPSHWVPCQAVADVYNEVVESNETNNVWAGDLPIPTPPPICTPTATPTATATATETPRATSVRLVLPIILTEY